MGKYNPKNLTDYEPEVALEKGWYIWKVVNIREDVSSKTGNEMLIVDIVCQEGKEQSNGKAPTGVESTLFLLTEFDNMSDRGKRMMQGKLSDFIVACGQSLKKAFDWDDLIEAEFEGFAKPDEYEGEIRTSVDKFRPLAQDEVDEEA
jgi:hypothetical protein